LPVPKQAKRVAILGGGITGLTAAYTLARARESGVAVEELLVEQSRRLGGSISTEHIDGFVVEGGPDSFLSEKPEAAVLCRELGLGDSLIGSNDAERRTAILHRGRLVPLPDGLMLLVPTRIWPMLTTPLVPLAGKLSVVTELFTTPRRDTAQGADESVASFVRRHFGDSVLENIADPLLAAVFGGDSERLSVRSVLPRFLEMERKYGSLTRAALDLRKRRRRTGTAAQPLFLTLKEGLGRMVEAMAAHVESSRICFGQRAIAIERATPGPVATDPASPAAGPYTIRCEAGGAYEADAVILALPAYECARLLSPLDSALVETLRAIPYSSGLTVSLGCDAPVARQLPPGFGFLAPHAANRRLIACTFAHQKFRHRAPEGCALVRCFLGGTRDPAILGLGDGEITSIVRGELESILNVTAEPRFVRICRWPSSMPQYVLGHQERVKTIRARLAAHPGLFLAGNAYSGIGISDCIRTGRAEARDAQKLLGLL
jgi:protoporphyrinogen/coproporphyrinogen III oxidase